MKRHHRRNHNEPGHAHELTFSCYRGFQFLKAERTSQWLGEAIQGARSVWSFHLWAYVFMPEHVHLVVCPRDSKYDIAGVRQAIKSPVARKAIRFIQEESPDWLPEISRRRGGKTERLFWQSGGGYDRNVVEPETLMKVLDYIHMNPVRRGLVEESYQWKWSSAAFYVRGEQCPIAVDPIPPEWLDGTG